MSRSVADPGFPPHGDANPLGRGSKNDAKQECIRVGCVPSAVVAAGRGVSARGCLPRGLSARRVSDHAGVCQGGVCPVGVCPVHAGIHTHPGQTSPL